MKQDKWTEQLHDKLADHKMAAPEGLWNDIEAALPKESTPRKAYFVAMRRWAAAASLVLLLGMGGYWWMTVSERTEMENTLLTKRHYPQNGTESDIHKSPYSDHQASLDTAPEMTQEVPIALARSEAYLALADKDATDSIKSTYVSVETDQTVNEQPAMAENTRNMGSKGTGNETADIVVSKPDIAVSMLKEESIVSLMDEQTVAISSHKESMASISFYAMNGFNDQTKSNGVIMGPEMASRFTHYSDDAYPTRAKEVIYLANYEEQQKHHQPVAFGLTVCYSLGNRLAISSGIVYTRLLSDFTSVTPNLQLVKKQALHYLGVPLSLHYRLWAYKGLKVYAAAGGQADWNVQTKLQAQGERQQMDKDRMQWSVNGSLGIQYEIIPQLGLYAEPGMKYYFDNGSSVQNLFKDQPFNFNLQVGIRLNVR